jgi:hypothetical protein
MRERLRRFVVFWQLSQPKTNNIISNYLEQKRIIDRKEPEAIPQIDANGTKDRKLNNIPFVPQQLFII